MLFRYLARRRVGEAGEAELEANAGRLETKEWPYAAVELYLGKRSPAATLDAAIEPHDHCQAQFHIGEWHLLKGNKPDAESALTSAIKSCPKTCEEYIAAVAEYKRLTP